MPVAVERIILNPQYASNCYLVRAGEDAHEAVVVDPGGDPAPLLGELDAATSPCRRSSSPTPTSTTSRASPSSPPATGRRGLGAGGRGSRRCAAARRAAATQRAAARARARVADGDTVAAAGLDASRSSRCPGHSAGHVAFAVDGAIFSGDLLFAGSVGRVDLAGRRLGARCSTRSQRLLDRYGPDAVVYPGHGEPTTLGRELETNPFLGELRARALSERRSSRRRAGRTTSCPPSSRSGSTRSSGTMEEVTRRSTATAASRRRRSRTPRSSSARRAPAPTSSRRRCTRSPTAATAR